MYVVVVYVRFFVFVSFIQSNPIYSILFSLHFTLLTRNQFFNQPEVEGSMENPQDFPKVLTFAMSVITTMYIIGGFAGYLTYGHLAESPVTKNITLRIVSHL